LVQGARPQYDAAIHKTAFVKGDRLEIDVRSVNSDMDAIVRRSNSWSIDCDGPHSRTILHENLSSSRFKAAIMSSSLAGKRPVYGHAVFTAVLRAALPL